MQKRLTKHHTESSEAYQLYLYSNFLAAMGRQDEAIEQARRAQELDPISLIINSLPAWICYFARQYDLAIEQCRKTLSKDPSFLAARRYLGMAYEGKGMYQEAIAEFQKAVLLSGGSPLMKAALGRAYAVSGKRGEAKKVLDELSELKKQRYISSYYIAAIYTGLKEKDQAFEWLDRAFREHASLLVYLKAEPMFDNLRSDPRFPELVRRVGLAP